MKIKTDSFRENVKLINHFNGQGDRRYSAIYLNFSDSKAYLTGQHYSGRFSFEYTDDKKDIDSFFIESQAFLLLCQRYEELEFNKEDDLIYIIANNKKFQIEVFFDDLDGDVYDYSDHTPYELSSDVVKSLKSASLYYGPEDFASSLYGVLLKEKNIITTDKIKLFHTKSDVEFPEVRISAHPVQVVFTASEQSPVTFYHSNEDNAKFFFVVGAGEFELVFPQTENIIIPDITDESFVSKYDHAEKFSFKKSDMERELKFFEIFVKEVRNERLLVTVKSDSELLIEATDDKKGEQSIAISDVHPDLIGKSFWVMRAVLLQALQVIGVEDVTIQYNEDQPTLNVSGTNTERHIVIVRLT